MVTAHAFIELVLLLLVVINPTAKVLVMSALAEGRKRKELRDLTLHANFVGLLLMAFFAFFGSFFLEKILNVSVDALKVAGGFVLIVIGFDYLWKGELGILQKVACLEEIAVAPFGTPLIAGPASLTTVIALASAGSPFVVVYACVGAIIINTVVMLAAVTYWQRISQQVLHSIIRLIGLFIMAVGVQMGLDGISHFFFSLPG